jgi:hypothetical protein
MVLHHSFLSSAGGRGSGSFSDDCVAVLVAMDRHEAPAFCETRDALATYNFHCTLQLATTLAPSPRQAEPRLGTLAMELGGAQCLNFESGFDGENHLARRPARRTSLLRWAFGRANEA